MKKRGIFGALIVLAGTLGLAAAGWGAAGDLLWEQSFNYHPDYNQMNIYPPVCSANTVIVYGGAVAQDMTTQSVLAIIRAFDAATGTPKWQASFNLARFNGVTVQIEGNIALVKISSYDISPEWTYNYIFGIKAYNVDTGQLLWEKTPVHQGVFQAPQTSVVNNRAFTAGVDLDASGHPTGDCWVQAYQVRSVEVPLSLLLDK